MTTLYYGAIKNLVTGEEYDWDEALTDQVKADLAKLSGTTYKIHWSFAGDIGDDGDVYADVDVGPCVTYYGASTIVDLATDLGVTIVGEA